MWSVYGVVGESSTHTQIYVPLHSPLLYPLSSNIHTHACIPQLPYISMNQCSPPYTYRSHTCKSTPPHPKVHKYYIYPSYPCFHVYIHIPCSICNICSLLYVPPYTQTHRPPCTYPHIFSNVSKFMKTCWCQILLETHHPFSHFTFIIMPQSR